MLLRPNFHRHIDSFGWEAGRIFSLTLNKAEPAQPYWAQGRFVVPSTVHSIRSVGGEPMIGNSGGSRWLVAGDILQTNRATNVANDAACGEAHRALSKRLLAVRLVSKAAVTLWCAALLVCFSAVAAEPRVALQSSRRAGVVDLVSVQIAASGERSGEPPGSLPPAGAKEKQKQKTPIEVACDLEYLERWRAVETKDTISGRSIRQYRKSKAELKIGGEVDTVELRPDRRYVVCESSPAITLFSPQGPLTIEEFDLVKQIGDSAVLDGLLPKESIEKGSAWQPSVAVVAALFGMDEVLKHDITCRVAEITDQVVRFELAGTAAGRINDAAANVEVRGKYRFDRRFQRIDWLGLFARIHCDLSAVWAEFDLSIRAQTRVLPAESAAELDEAKIAEYDTPVSPERLLLELVPQGKEWRLLHSRNWFATNFHREVATLRLLRNGEYVAFASISLLPKRPPEQIPTLADFQADVKKALGKSYEELEDAGQSINQLRNRILRVIVRGRLDDSPRQWRYYHITDPIGRQAVIALNIEEKMVSKLGNEDVELLNGFNFLPPAEVRDTPASGADGAGESEERKDASSASTSAPK